MIEISDNLNNPIFIHNNKIDMQKMPRVWK